MKRAMGSFVVLGLIGGALWIGWNSGGAVSVNNERGSVFIDESAVAAPSPPVTGGGLECPEGDLIQQTDVDIGGRGFRGAPEDAVRETLRGIRPTDELVLGSRREVHILRGDKLIGTASFFKSPKGGWLVDGSSVCASAGIRH